MSLLTPPQGCDVCCLIGMPKLHEDCIKYVKYCSLLSCVDCVKEQIDLPFSKVTKYDIRRSNEDELNIFHYTSDFLSSHQDIYAEFAKLYDEMYKAKGLSATANIDSMKNVAENNGLLISCARNKSIPLVFHVYVIDGKSARLWMSTSIFRESEDKQFRAKVGRANKRLHYEDLLYFHDNGYCYYDWGGISSFDKPNGIDLFKMSFGGTYIEYYNETFICSFRYKLFYNLKNRIKKNQI